MYLNLLVFEGCHTPFFFTLNLVLQKYVHTYNDDNYIE